MKNIVKLFFCIIFFLSAYSNSYSQETDPKKDKISRAITDYFSLERENIHIQFNKSTYLTNEEVWLKGYVYNRKEKLPFFFTTNVYVVLYDEDGTKIESKLLYANSGCFSGKFALSDGFKTGKYYLHIYTNWMNNFKEDESGKFEFNVINTKDKMFFRDVPDYAKINIEFFPEGGAIIEGTLNTIGIKISDCNGKALSIIKEAGIVNPKGDTIQKIAINKFGNGKFQLQADNKIYKASFLINGQRVEQYIPAALASGIALEINSYVFKEKTIAKIKTNKKSIEKFKTENLYLVVQQDSKSAIFDIDFSNGNLEQTLTFSNNNLFEGINTIRIIDSNNNQLAERYVFKYPADPLTADFTFPSKKKDKVGFTGKFNFQNTKASISVLPENSLSATLNDNIFASFLINPYFTKKQTDINYYLTEVSKIKHYEFDLLLLNQNSGKYKWEDIVAEPPTIVHAFDLGFTLKGTINQPLSDPKKYKVHLYSLMAQIEEPTEIEEKNEFNFRNLVIADSTKVFFSLAKNGEKPTSLKVYPQILNLNRTFNKSFTVEKNLCSKKDSLEYDLPDENMQIVLLDDVEIKIDKKKLKYKNILGNGGLKGRKITDDDPSINMDLVDYIRNNGFDVERYRGEYIVYSRRSPSLNGRSSPTIYVGGIQQINFDFLQNMKMKDVDEIYISSHATSPTSRNNVGIIKVYPKNITANFNSKPTSVAFEIKNAFSKIEVFKNIKYKSTDNKGFQNFGVINWIPSIVAYETGEFRFDIPEMHQKKVNLLIEGFTDEGKLISEIRTVTIP